LHIKRSMVWSIRRESTWPVYVVMWCCIVYFDHWRDYMLIWTQISSVNSFFAKFLAPNADNPKWQKVLIKHIQQIDIYAIWSWSPEMSVKVIQDHSTSKPNNRGIRPVRRSAASSAWTMGGLSWLKLRNSVIFKFISTKIGNNVRISVLNSCVKFLAKVAHMTEISTKVERGGYFLYSPCWLIGLDLWHVTLKTLEN